MTNQYLWDRITGPDPHLRAADADRERTAERLRTAHAEGRLDMTEFQERLERCYEAKTMGELRALLRDLPHGQDEDARRAAGRTRAGRWRLAPLVPLVLLLIIIGSATGHHHGGGWLWIPIVFLIWRLAGRHRRWVAVMRRPPGGWL